MLNKLIIINWEKERKRKQRKILEWGQKRKKQGRYEQKVL